MLVAVNQDGKRIHPIRGAKAFCPGCNKPVIAKCGDVNIHHWAHEVDYDCIQKEPETQWHLYSKNLFDIQYQEKIVSVLGTTKRADIKLKNNLVIEFQNSPISIDEIESRENIYLKMIWVLNLNNKDYFTYDDESYEWSHPIKNINEFRFPIFFNYKEHYIRILNFKYDFYLKEEYHKYNTRRLIGDCRLYSKSEFIEFMHKIDNSIDGYNIRNFIYKYKFL